MRHDTELLTTLTTQPEIVLHIAQRTNRADTYQEIIAVEADLYRLASIRPGQEQPSGVGQVRNYRSTPGVPVMWSRQVGSDVG